MNNTMKRLIYWIIEFALMALAGYLFFKNPLEKQFNMPTVMLVVTIITLLLNYLLRNNGKFLKIRTIVNFIILIAAYLVLPAH